MTRCGSRAEAVAENRICDPTDRRNRLCKPVIAVLTEDERIGDAVRLRDAGGTVIDEIERVERAGAEVKFLEGKRFRAGGDCRLVGALCAAGARSLDEIESASEIQEDVSRRELGRLTNERWSNEAT